MATVDSVSELDEMSLDALACAANEEHQLSEQCFEEGLDHAMKCGCFLIKAKEEVKHGGWEKWVGTNCVFTTRMASTYMRLASNRKRVSDLGLKTIRDALDKLAEADTKSKEAFANAEAFVSSLNNQALWVREAGGIVGYTEGWTEKQLDFFFGNLERLVGDFTDWIDDYKRSRNESNGR